MVGVHEVPELGLSRKTTSFRLRIGNQIVIGSNEGPVPSMLHRNRAIECAHGNLATVFDPARRHDLVDITLPFGGPILEIVAVADRTQFDPERRDVCLSVGIFIVPAILMVLCVVGSVVFFRVVVSDNYIRGPECHRSRSRSRECLVLKCLRSGKQLP